MKFLKGYENGNHITKIYDDGTKIKETGHFEFRPLPGMKGGPKVWVPDDADHFTYDFPENADIKITDYCDAGCAYCHENSTVKGVHGDLRRIEKTIDSLHAGTELAIGGGNALAHPDLIWFLEKLKKKGVIAIEDEKLKERGEKPKDYITRYCYSDEERQQAIADLGPDPEITRFKGLGEISPDEFAGFIGPDIRLEQVTLQKSDEVGKLLAYYMGKNTMERQQFIIDNLVIEEDIPEDEEAFD